MKRLLLLLVPLSAFSQPHASLFKSTKDKFTDEVTTDLKTPIIITKGKGIILVNFIKTSQGYPTLTFVVQDNSFGCTLEEGNHLVYFLSTDGEKFKAYNSAKSCKGQVFIFLQNGPAINEPLRAWLQSHEIAAVKITNDKLDYEFNLSKPIAAKIKAAASELFGDAQAGDETAPVPKKAVIAAPGKSN